MAIKMSNIPKTWSNQKRVYVQNYSRGMKNSQNIFGEERIVL